MLEEPCSENVAGFLLLNYRVEPDPENKGCGDMTMNILKATYILLIFLLLPGCSAVSFTVGLIPGAPGAVASAVGNGHTVYGASVDERSLRQQIVDSVIAGHAQAELYKHKKIRPLQISAYCYFGKLYLVGEYDSQEQLELIYECVNKVENKRAVISRLYQKRAKGEKIPEDEVDEPSYAEEAAMQVELQAQLTADFEVTSSPIVVEIVHGDVVLLGAISDQDERNRIVAHALDTAGVDRVVSYLYHSEISGPEPRIMTAELMPKNIEPEPLKPLAKKKKIVRPKRTPLSAPVVAITNPDSGR